MRTWGEAYCIPNKYRTRINVLLL
ncbi:rCG51984 [Rattus norvegicus]|uniref:RCG51984 n=1 Tax=Rattus norvegicus TaxID=10116 RepID=A6K3C6_RAT|nr:rCG51984 [Rattus norvegicus]